MLNRLQAISSAAAADRRPTSSGACGMRIAGATKFPRAMAFGATGDEQLAFEAGKDHGAEGRALGVHVDFAPVADVNNNPRNPVINIRSFGEDPARVGAMVAAWVARPAGGRHARDAEAFSRATATPTSTRISACR